MATETMTVEAGNATFGRIHRGCYATVVNGHVVEVRYEHFTGTDNVPDSGWFYYVDGERRGDALPIDASDRLHTLAGLAAGLK